MDTVETTTHESHSSGVRIQRVGAVLLRVALVMIFLPIGLQKFSAYEADAIEPFVANSPFFSWAYQSMGLQTTSGAIGIFEILIGLMLAVGLFSRGSLLSLLGAIGSAITYVLTLSFLLTTPGVLTSTEDGIPLLTADVGQFLVKDMVLLAASIYLIGEALTARGT